MSNRKQKIAAPTVALHDVVADTKRRKLSTRERDDNNRVIRAGKNLSGNQPFAPKHYYFDVAAKQSQDFDLAFAALPTQVRLIIKSMERANTTSASTAARGGEIVQVAIDAGLLKTKIDPPVLFAYYRRLMQTVGLRQA